MKRPGRRFPVGRRNLAHTEPGNSVLRHAGIDAARIGIEIGLIVFAGVGMFGRIPKPVSWVMAGVTEAASCHVWGRGAICG